MTRADRVFNERTAEQSDYMDFLHFESNNMQQKQQKMMQQWNSEIPKVQLQQAKICDRHVVPDHFTRETKEKEEIIKTLTAIFLLKLVLFSQMQLGILNKHRGD